jgi:uncharacterized protein involved in response to NO
VNRSLSLQGELPVRSSRPGLALASKGFRPFFLLAAVFACCIVPVWLLVLAGLVRPTSYLDATTWHAHEMVLGFCIAVIAGFLLTAVGNWTQRETLVGPGLLVLAGLWVLGRVAMLFPDAFPRGVVACIDLAFLPALIAVLARPLVATGNRRNFVMLAILGALFAANVVVHLSALGAVSAGAGRVACLVAIDVVLLVILVIAGRTFPMFTRNATGASGIRSVGWLDVLTIASMALLVVLDALFPQTTLSSSFAGAVGVLALARAARWGTWHTGKHPLLWILHAGYGWCVAGLLLRGCAGFVPTVPSSLATHALTVGAIGSLTLGMMARVALGHTGRPMVAAKPVVWAFMAITAAAIVRVTAPLLAAGWYLASLVAAGTLWTLAFALYVTVYAPILSAPRIDGKAG